MFTIAALAKVPLLLARGWIVFHSFTSPTPTPSAQERQAPTTAIERKLTEMIGWPFFISKVMFASDALIESSCILAASELLPTHLSLTILQALTDSSNISIQTFSPSLPWIFGTLLVIITGFFRLQSYRALGRHFTYELSVLKDHKLITTGPYAWVRHPSYTAFIALLVGNAIAISARGSWTHEIFFRGLFTGPWSPSLSLTKSEGLMTRKRILVLMNVCGQVVLAAALVSRTKIEDEMMKNEFGEQWQE